MKQGVLLHLRSDVEISGRRAHGAGVSLAGDAQPGTVARAGRNPHFDAFGFGHAAVAAAGGAGVAEPAGAAAAGAGEAELHGARHLGHVAGALALRTGDFARAGGTGAVAGAADFVAGDVEARLGTFDGLAEIDVHHVLQVAALFRLYVGFGCAAFVAEELGEDVAETAGPGGSLGAPGAASGAGRAGEGIGKIEAVEVHAGVRGLARCATRIGGGKTAFGVEAVLVVHGALLGIAQDIIGLLHVLETVFGGLIPGVEIGVVLAGELSIGFADVVRGCLLGDAERFVILVLGRRHI